MPTPLQGIRVLDWTQWQAGPVATAMLGELGAEVIHVEHRTMGDPARGLTYIEKSRLPPDKNSYFEYNNRGKKSITIDVSKKQGQEIMYKLVKVSDVFVHNYRLDVPPRVGLDYETLKKHNPKLIYAGLSGYGPKGPEANEPVFDYLAVARSGIMTLAGESDMPPNNIRRGIADMMGSIMTAYGVLAALVARERLGVGQEINTSLMGGMMALEGLPIGMWLYGSDTRRNDRSSAPNPLWNHYQCKDDTWIVLAMLQPDRAWPAFCKGIGFPELENDPRFDNLDHRRDNCREIIRLMNEKFAAKTAKEWVKILKEAGDIICTNIQTIYDVPNDPQMLANNYIINYNHETLGPMQATGLPVQFSETPGIVKWEAPSFGQHTEEVLLDLCGASWEEITRLKDEEVI